MSLHKRPLEEAMNHSLDGRIKKPLLASEEAKSRHHPEKNRPASTFISHLEIPNLPPKIKLVCDIISSTPPSSIESTLSAAAVRISSSEVEEILKLSYNFPNAAVTFFRWAGFQLQHRQSPYSWNLVVDLLGKNLHFDAMWDAIKSMHSEQLLSLATFASVFSSYSTAGKPEEALMTFDAMEKYGCPRDVRALNSLLSAVCRSGQTRHAWEFFIRARKVIHPDADTFAILLEGWENEGEAEFARQTFGEMIVSLGWDPANVPAYDSFLNALLKSPNGETVAMIFFEQLRQKQCFPGMKFLGNALELFARTANHRAATALWEDMVIRGRCRPDTKMYNLMIVLQCQANRLDYVQFLDDMVFNGVFPDSETYNIILQYTIKNKRVRDVASVFKEMVKNDFLPSHANCTSAIPLFLDARNPEMAIWVWKCMAEKKIVPLEDTANFLVVELPRLHRLQEAAKYAEDMAEKGIKLNSSTLSKLKQSLVKAGKEPVYDQILRKWKLH